MNIFFDCFFACMFPRLAVIRPQFLDFNLVLMKRGDK